MPRIPRVRGLQSLQLATAPSKTLNRAPFAATRAISTTAPVHDLRSKLWKGEAPGPEDPYTQRPEPEDISSNLPDEARHSRYAPTGTQRRSGSRLALPPKRTEATTEKELAANDPTYTPATSIEELDEIPALKSWWEQPGHWGEESGFKGFGKSVKEVNESVLEVHLRRAVVEVLALEQEGKLASWLVKKWPEGERSSLDQALDVEIVTKDGKSSLKGNASSIVEFLVQDTAELTENSSPEITLEEASEIVQAWDPEWKEVNVNDEVKFAIRKRLYQLTGNLIPDAKLGAANTVKDLLAVAAKQPKPKKLAEVLEKKAELGNLPNVRLHSRKIGPIDKEVEIGRWKVIEEELKKRGLPVTGTADLSGHKEKKWMRGEM